MAALWQNVCLTAHSAMLQPCECMHVAAIASRQTESHLPLRLCLVTPLKRDERGLVALAALV